MMLTATRAPSPGRDDRVDADAGADAGRPDAPGTLARPSASTAITSAMRGSVMPARMSSSRPLVRDRGWRRVSAAPRGLPPSCPSLVVSAKPVVAALQDSDVGLDPGGAAASPPAAGRDLHQIPEAGPPLRGTRDGCGAWHAASYPLVRINDHGLESGYGRVKVAALAPAVPPAHDGQVVHNVLLLHVSVLIGCSRPAPVASAELE